MVSPINASQISVLKPKQEASAPQQKSGLFAASQAIIEQLRKPTVTTTPVANTPQISFANIAPNANLPRGSLIDVVV